MTRLVSQEDCVAGAKLKAKEAFFRKTARKEGKEVVSRNARQVKKKGIKSWESIISIVKEKRRGPEDAQPRGGGKG